jgi:hypothetical protein
LLHPNLPLSIHIEDTDGLAGRATGFVRSTMFTPAVKRQTTTAAAAAAAAAAAPGAAGGLRMAWVRVSPKADKAEGAPAARWGGVAVAASASQVYVHGGLMESACAKDLWTLRNTKWGGRDWQVRVVTTTVVPRSRVLRERRLRPHSAAQP